MTTTTMDLHRQAGTARDDLGMLAVMDALAAEQQVTQRQLALRTGLNLKKVNFCLHRLLERGHVKFQRAVAHPRKRAYLYILTPAGLRAKSHLAYRFLQISLSFYNQVTDRLRVCLEQMGARGVRRLVLYGATDAARVVLEELDQGRLAECQVTVVAVVDDGQAGAQFHGVPVLGLADMAELKWDAVLITALDGVEQAGSRLRAGGCDAARVWQLS